jgi:hypothetical protein
MKKLVYLLVLSVSFSFSLFMMSALMLPQILYLTLSKFFTICSAAEKFAKITLDDGGIIEVTPDHKMMLRDGNPIKASDVMPGMSLMPMHVSYSTMLNESCDKPTANCYEKNCI